MRRAGQWLSAIFMILSLLLYIAGPTRVTADNGGLPFFSGQAQGEGPLQFQMAVSPPVAQPGDMISLTLTINNNSANIGTPVVNVALPAGLAADVRELPTGTSLNVQTNHLVWTPIANAAGGVAQINLPFTIDVADLTQPEKVISATISQDDWQQTITAHYWVGVLPEVSITLSPAQVSVGQPLQMLANIVGPGPFVQQWDLGDGRLFNAENPVVVYPAAGIYTVTLRVANPLGAAQAVGLVNVLPEPAAYFTLDDATPGVDQTVTFLNLSGGQPPLQYSWDFGDGTASSEHEPQHAYAAPGTYTVRLTTSNEFGQAESSWQVTVGTAPVADLVLPPEATAGQPFSAQAVGDATVSEYRWDMGDGSVYTGEQISHVYRQNGDIYVTLQASNDYGTISVGRWLSVAPGQWDVYLPFAGLTARQAVATVTETVAIPEEVGGAPAVLEPISLPQAPLSAEATQAEQLLWYVNEARRLHNLPPLDYSYELAIAAQQHTDDMATFGYTGHTGTDGSHPWERIFRYGYTGEYAGEATAWGFDLAIPVVEFWVNSPGHRVMILNPEATEVGVGYTFNPNAPNVWYWTVEFGTRRPEEPVADVPTP